MTGSQHAMGLEAKAQVNLKTRTHDIKLGLKLQVAGYFPEKLGSGCSPMTGSKHAG